MMDKYHPGYFGKVGMRYFHKNKAHFHCPVINVEKLWTLVSEEARTKCPKGKAVVINCNNHVSAPPRPPPWCCAAGAGAVWPGGRAACDQAACDAAPRAGLRLYLPGGCGRRQAGERVVSGGGGFSAAPRAWHTAPSRLAPLAEPGCVRLAVGCSSLLVAVR